MGEITVYGADWCPDCTRTKRALEVAGADYVYRDLVAEPEAAAEAEAISGRKNIPVVVLLRNGSPTPQGRSARTCLRTTALGCHLPS